MELIYFMLYIFSSTKLFWVYDKQTVFSSLGKYQFSYEDEYYRYIMIIVGQ